jgi:peroxiredoxin 2/4
MSEEIIKAICNETRLKIITCLARKEKTVTELVNTCKLNQSAISQHLNKLREAEIVKTRKEGRQVFYSLANKEMAHISNVLLNLSKKEHHMHKPPHPERPRMPLLGDKFPELTVKTTRGSLELPKAFKGKWFVLFSHPADFTPVCTTEFVAFQKRNKEFKKLNCELIGMSVDQVYAHIKWEEWIEENLDVEIKFPIIADTGKVAETLGLIHPGKGTNTVRAVFVVDPEGLIRTILYYPQEMGRNMDEVVRIVKGLQVADENKVAMPANWPNNELFDDHVIIPPASDVKSAKERMKSKNKDYECVDWWLCHKKL